MSLKVILIILSQCEITVQQLKVVILSCSCDSMLVFKRKADILSISYHTSINQ